MIARLVIAAPASGSGKTTLTAGLIGSLRRRGLVVQPFKCGPDYIDPGYHSLSAGRPCRNLDTWLLERDQVLDLFSRACAGADIALVEGVMGLFDGYGALDETGSTADVARLLEAPVLLVVDARGMARSAAALVDGFQRFDPRVRIGGVLLNHVGSERHANLCASAIAAHTGLACLGYLPRSEDMRLPERHLGLMTIAEEGPWVEVLERAAATLSETCDLDTLLALAREAKCEDEKWASLPSSLPSATRSSFPAPPVIAIARDAAFSFTYPETEELLRAAGAQLLNFSPIADTELPAATCGLILSGGFPELYAEQLSRNVALHKSIKQAHAAGLPIYAECGGLMYLTEQLLDQEGRCWPMIGLLPGRSVMTKRVVLGYRTARAASDNPLLPAGATVRGHEFHYSRWEDRPSPLRPAYELLGPNGTAAHEGALLGNLLASYIHLHWLARPEMAERFVGWCQTGGSQKLL